MDSFALMYVCRVPVEALEPVGQELQQVVSYQVGAGIWTQAHWKRNNFLAMSL